MMQAVANKYMDKILRCVDCQDKLNPPYLIKFSYEILTSYVMKNPKCTRCYDPATARAVTAFENWNSRNNRSCRRSNYGCRFTTVAEHLDEHEEDCEFGLTVCNSFARCFTVFYYDDVMEHYRRKHPETVKTYGNETIIDSFVTRKKHAAGFTILKKFNTYFKVMWRAEFAAKKVTYLGTNYGFCQSVERYQYVIKMEDDAVTHVKSGLHYSTPGNMSEVDTGSLLQHDMAVTVEFEDLDSFKSFLSRRNSMRSVKILKKPLTALVSQRRRSAAQS